MNNTSVQIKVGLYGGAFFFTLVGFANPFFSLYASELGFSTAVIGLLVTLRAALPILIAMPSGQLIDAIGPLRMLRYGVVLLCLSMLMVVFGTSVLTLGLSQIFFGASITVMVSCLQVLVSKGNAEIRNANIKKYSMWIAAGSMVGPILGGYIVSMFDGPHTGYRMLFLFASGIAMVFFLCLSGLLAFVLKGAHEPVDKPTLPNAGGGLFGSYTECLKLVSKPAVKFGLIITFIMMFIQAIYISFVPLFLSEVGYSPFFISVCLSLYGLAGIVFRFLISWLNTLMSLQRLLLVAGFVGATTVALVPFAGLNDATIMVLLFIMGGAVGLNLPVSIIIMVDVIREQDRGKLMGLRLLSNRTAQMFGPAMFGITGQLIGLAGAFYAGGALLLALMTGFAVLNRVIRRRIG